MVFPLINVTTSVAKVLYDTVKHKRDESNEDSNVMDFLNASLDECDARNDPVARDKILSLKNEFEKGRINRWFVINRIGMLLGNPTTTNNSQTNYSVSNYQYFVNVLQENQANDFLSNKEANYMYIDDEKKINRYIHCCIGREVDPVLHSTQHLDRSEFSRYDDSDVYDMFNNMLKCIAATDFKNNEVFKDIPKYINQLKDSIFTISLFGEVNSGKSTIINSIVGIEIAHTLVETCTALPVIYENDRHRDIPVLMLSTYFIKHGFQKVYEGDEIMPVLVSINELARKRQDDLEYDEWPVIRAHFHNIDHRIRIIDTPGISEQSETITGYSKQALMHSVSAMIVFRCDRINTDIELRIRESLHKGKHLYLVANRWDEYRHNIDGDEKITKEHLKSRLKQRYKKVFVTIGDSGFVSAKLDMIATDSKPPWDEAKVWVHKCMGNVSTDLEELEADYEEMSLNTLKRKIKTSLRNSGIAELIDYINTEIVNEIKYKTISYICTTFIQYLHQFENKKNPIRESVIKSIFTTNEELEKNIRQRENFDKLIQKSKTLVIARQSSLHSMSDNIDKIAQHLYDKYDSIKSFIRDLSKAEKPSISERNKDDIIFFNKDRDRIIDEIVDMINTVMYQYITDEVNETNHKLSVVLSDMKQELLHSQVDKRIATFIENVNVNDYIYTGGISKIATFQTYQVNIDRPQITRWILGNERPSTNRESISQASYRSEVDKIIKDLIMKYKEQIKRHVDNTINSYIKSIDQGGNEIFNEIDAMCSELSHNMNSGMLQLEERTQSDLKLTSCILISKLIMEKYSLF